MEGSKEYGRSNYNITTAYGLYALIVVQLFGMIKIYIDRGNTKKERDDAIEALKTKQENVETMAPYSSTVERNAFCTFIRD